MLRAVPTAIGIHKPAESVALRAQFLDVAHAADWRVGPIHVAQRRALNDLRVTELAIGEMKSNPLQHVLGTRVDRARWADKGDVAERHGLDGVTANGVRQRVIRIRLRLLHREVGAPHAKRRENELAQPFLPRGAVDDADEVAGGEEHQVVVLKGLAQIAIERQIRHPTHELLARGHRVVVPEQIVTRESATMRHEIARCDTQRHGVILHAEPGEIRAHGRVPLELPLIHQRAHCERRERFGRRSNGEDRARRDRECFLAIAKPVALEVHRLTVHRDAHRQSHHLPCDERGIDPGVHPCECGACIIGLRSPRRHAERKRRSALREGAANRASIAASHAAERGRTWNALNREARRITAHTHIHQWDIARVLRGDGDITSAARVGLPGEVDIEHHLRGRQIDRAVPMPGAQVGGRLLRGEERRQQKCGNEAGR